jgi:hypothetical protein
VGAAPVGSGSVSSAAPAGSAAAGSGEEAGAGDEAGIGDGAAGTGVTTVAAGEASAVTSPGTAFAAGLAAVARGFRVRGVPVPEVLVREVLVRDVLVRDVLVRDVLVRGRGAFFTGVAPGSGSGAAGAVAGATSAP